MNLILWVEGSSAAIPFGTLVAILALWFGISVPLTFIGAYFGFKKPVSKASRFSVIFGPPKLWTNVCFWFSLNPLVCSSAGHWAARTNKPDPSPNSRAVLLHQTHPWNNNGWDLALWLHFHSAFLYPQQYLVSRQKCCPPGLLSSSCFNLGWKGNRSTAVCSCSFRSHQMYYMFGFLFLVFIILLITCSEATILLCYFHLCAEVTWYQTWTFFLFFFVSFPYCWSLMYFFLPSSVSEGLPLVVAFLLDQWLHSSLPVHLCCALLLLKTANNWSSQYHTILWIHHDYGPHLLPLHR